MDKTQLAQYQSSLIKYQDVLQQVITDLGGFLKTQNIDTLNVYGRVKKVESITHKLQQIKKSSLSDIEDLVGLTVVCYTSSDVDQVILELNDYFKKTTDYELIDSKLMDTNQGYKAHHFVLKYKKGKDVVACEVQIKTVMQYSWSVLSHKYLYKKTEEGDSNTLAKVVAGILDNCENLWELVKKSSNASPTSEAKTIATGIEQELSKAGKVPAIERVVTEEVHEAEMVEPPLPIEGPLVEKTRLELKNKIDELHKRYVHADQVEIKDLIESEVNNIKKSWSQVSEIDLHTVVRVEPTLTAMTAATNGLTLLGLSAIKFSRLDTLTQLLDNFGPIIDLSKNQSGLTTILSIPGAILHNPYYYWGIYSVKIENASALNLLLQYRMERHYSGKYFLERPWSSGAIFSPAVVRGADETFRKLLKDFDGENFAIKDFMGLTTDELTTLACQFNLIVCMKWQQLLEVSEKIKEFIWSYPSFGNFFAQRIYILVQRLKLNPKYENFIETVFEEKAEVFKQKAEGRYQKLTKIRTSGIFWESLNNWNDN